MPSANKKQKIENKRPRAEVHKVQESVATRAFESMEDVLNVIITTMQGTGKPRIVGRLVDMVVKKLVSDLEQSDTGVLTIVCPTNVKQGREQAAQYGVDFPGPYHDSDLGAVCRLLEQTRTARIMIPFHTLRKMLYSLQLLKLLKSFNLGPEHVILVFDEVAEVYGPSNGRMPTAITDFRTMYARAIDGTIHMIGMSGTDGLDEAAAVDEAMAGLVAGTAEASAVAAMVTKTATARAARAKTLFGVKPTRVGFIDNEKEVLLDDINLQRKVSSCDHSTVATLPVPSDPVETLEKLSTLVVGDALTNELGLGNAAIKKLGGEVQVEQVLGDDQDGGQLFMNLAPGGKAPMLTVNKDGTIGKKVTQAHETVLVAVDSTYGTQALLDALVELQKRSGTEGELRAFTVHDMRLESQVRAAKEADKVPHAYLIKRDVADQKAALKKALADTLAQKGTTIIIIDKSQALSGTNDFAKNVQRAIAIGAWEAYELDQFYKRLCRACLLEPGDLVAKVFYGVHIASPFVANLTAKPDQRLIVKKDELSDPAKAELAKLEAAADTAGGEDMYHKTKKTAMVLAATQLPDDPALTYLKCLNDQKEQEAFLKNEYKPLIEHHKDCEREEIDEINKKTGENKIKVVKCCGACRCIFVKDGNDDDE